MRKNGFTIMYQLLGLVKPLLHIMVITITMGIAGFLCAIFITIFGGLGILNIAGFDTGITLGQVFLVMAILAILRGALRYAEQASGHYIAFKLLAIIRDRVFTALRKLTPAKLEGKDKGNLISVITTDIELLEVFYAHTIAPIVIGVLTSAIMVWFIGSYHYIFGIIATLAYVTVGVIIPVVNGRMGREDGRELRDKFGHLNSFLLESLRGLRETLQYGDGKNRRDEMNCRSEDLEKSQSKLKKWEGVSGAVTDSVILLYTMVMLYVAISLMDKGIIDFAGVLIPVIALISSFGPTVTLSNLSNNLLQTLACGERVLAILEENPIVNDICGKDSIERDAVGDIQCESIDFSYGAEQILKDVTLTIPKGKIVGIHGVSGSGKSTLLKLLMRFWKLNHGTIAINQTEINDINTSSLRNLEGYMTQETWLFKDTIEANIKISKLNASRDEVIEAAKKASIHDFIVSLPNGYDTMVTELGSSLSGGERQRLGLARAFLHDAPIMLLDEPTSNLDSLNEGFILRALDEQRANKTVVLVSHRKSTLNISDIMFHMDSGRVS